MEQLFVINASGQPEPFSFRKVFASAKRSGASNKVATEIALDIRDSLSPGEKTKDIFQKVKTMLLEHDFTSGVRFNLKEAIRRLGPSGFPFEKYVASIYEKMGYQVDLNKKIRGKCIVHEIDFVAKKEKEVIIGECKYRISPGDRVDVKNALATHATFLDLHDGTYFKNFAGCEFKNILVTNAKFTTQAIKYAKCVGMDLLGWRHPTRGGLEHMIESNMFYPITILPSFRGLVTNLLSTQNKVLIDDILKVDPVKLANDTGIQKERLLPLIEEAKTLLELKSIHHE